MGNTLSAIVAFGVKVDYDNGSILPWQQEEFEGDEQQWWCKINGYTPPFEIYDESGNYIGGIKPSRERVKEYYDAIEQWKTEHPIPFVTKTYGYGDDLGTIVTSPKYPHLQVDWEAINFDLEDLQIQPDKVYEQFLAQYLPELGKPKWILAAKYF